MALKVINGGFASKQVSGVTNLNDILMPGGIFLGGGFNSARITVMGSQLGDGSLLGYFKVDGTEPSDTAGGGEPCFDGQSYFAETREEVLNFQFIQASSYDGNESDTYISVQVYINNSQVNV